MIHVVAGLIVDGDGQLLACRRPEGKHLGGLWEFPGGKVEPGESTRKALARELKEELDITIEGLKPLRPVVHDYGRGPIKLIPFLCTIAKGIPHLHEHSEMKWCAPHELVLLDWAAADLPILEEFLANCPK